MVPIRDLMDFVEGELWSFDIWMNEWTGDVDVGRDTG
jgi:hypothetical protein